MVHKVMHLDQCATLQHSVTEYLLPELVPAYFVVQYMLEATGKPDDVEEDERLMDEDCPAEFPEERTTSFVAPKQESVL